VGCGQLSYKHESFSLVLVGTIGGRSIGVISIACAEGLFDSPDSAWYAQNLHAAAYTTSICVHMERRVALSYAIDGIAYLKGGIGYGGN
jgi:hypothetical protein